MKISSTRIENSIHILKRISTKILETRTTTQRKVRLSLNSKATIAEKSKILNRKFRLKRKNNKTLMLRSLIRNVKLEEVAVKSKKDVTMKRKTK
jgi:hypothetical protein